MNTMAKKQTLEDKLIDLISEQFKQFNKKQDENALAIRAVVEDNKEIKGRVEKLELKDKAKNRSIFKFIEDRQLVGLFLFALVMLLLVIANLTSTEIPKWLTR